MSSGMWHCVLGLGFPSVLKKSISLTLKKPSEPFAQPLAPEHMYAELSWFLLQNEVQMSLFTTRYVLHSFLFTQCLCRPVLLIWIRSQTAKALISTWCADLPQLHVTIPSLTSLQRQFHRFCVKGKGNIVLTLATKEYRGNWLLAPLIINLCAIWGGQPGNFNSR